MRSIQGDLRTAISICSRLVTNKRDVLTDTLILSTQRLVQVFKLGLRQGGQNCNQDAFGIENDSHFLQAIKVDSRSGN